MTRHALRPAELEGAGTGPDRREDDRFRVLIAGGGVAALEGLLALRAIAGNRVDIDLLAPDREFVYRPLAVAEPFGRGAPRRFDIAEIAAEHGAGRVADSLVSVDPERHQVRTGSGAHIEYGALLIAVGTQPLEAVPGAVTYRGAPDNERFARILDDLEEGRAKRVAFAVPAAVSWALPLYELALLTATHLSRQGVQGAELVLVTPEVEPLSLFGSRASAGVRRLLQEAGVKLRTATTPAYVDDGHLALQKGSGLSADHVVALPALRVPPIPGIAQRRNGFIGTDAHMKVPGLADVYAAGDVTSFPVKQGGLAAQQADVAAASIAGRAGAAALHEPFRPVLRAAMLTGSVPHYLRADTERRPDSSAETERPLWWPPSKVAGRYLAPYLAVGRSEQVGRQLTDLEPLLGDDTEAEPDHRDAVGLALTMADADARRGDYDAALRWLDVAQQLDLVLPPEYERKRRRWSAEGSP